MHASLAKVGKQKVSQALEKAAMIARSLRELPKRETAKQTSWPVGVKETGSRPSASVLSSCVTEERKWLYKAK